MKGKKIIFGIIALVMFMAMVWGASAMTIDGDFTGQSVTAKENIKVTDGKIQEDIHQLSVFQQILERKSFSFIEAKSSELDVGKFSCELESTHGVFHKPPGKLVNSGAGCNVDEFIIFTSYGGDIDGGKYLFANAWEKTSSTDLLSMHKYYTNELDFEYYYGCYTCEELEEEEEEDLSESIEFISIQTDKSEYEVGDVIYITGKADINNDVDNAIIETSLSVKDYVSYQSFSLVEETSDKNSGVCGDDLTTGVKFDADEGDVVKFTLRMTAKKEGKYTVKVIGANGCGEGITDTYTLSSFKIVQPEEPVITSSEKQEETVTKDTESTDLRDDPIKDENKIEEDPINNVIDKIDPATSKTSKSYFDFKNNPEVAYSIVGMILILLILIGAVIFNSKGK